MKHLFASAVALLLSLSPLFSQTPYQTLVKIDGYVQFENTMDPSGRVSCIQYVRDEAYMETLRKNAEKSGLHIITETVGRRNTNGAMQAAATGLDIILRATTQLESFPEAKQAFIVAASRWEQILKNPVTVTIDVDFGTTFFGSPFSSSNVIGSTTSATGSVQVSMSQFADSLAARNPQYADIYHTIPDTLPNTTAVIKPIPAGALANILAIGFPAPTSSTPRIGFNSAFAFDFDPSNGITSSKMDFDGVAVHEMGHALGFMSIIGSTGRAYPWDLFRFRPGAVTDSISFKISPRVLTPGPSPSGGDQVFWDGSREWEVSTATSGRTGGDGQQASHWRDDAQRSAYPAAERYIGIMDPNTGNGERDTIMLSDKKALSVMGWQIDLPKTPSRPAVLKAESDYKTPTSVKIQWKNPRRNFDGSLLENFKVVVKRDGIIIKEFTTVQREQSMVFVDSGLVQYRQYTYIVGIVLNGTVETGDVVTVSLFAGGSPAPAPGTLVSAMSNGSTAIVSVKSPNRHDDQTILHNLKMAKVFRNNLMPASILDSLMLTPSDTGKIITVTDTPPSKMINSNSYQFIFYGAAVPDAEGGVIASFSLPSGRISSVSYLESFEVNKQSVVSDGLWDSTNVSAHSGTFSFGALNYTANDAHSAYLPQIRGAGTPVLKFWTICRTEAGADFGLVQASRDRGKSWQTLLSLTEADHAEWAAGNNTWFKYEIPLTAYATDTILVRFRLTSNGSVNKFGWLVDDIELSPVATGVTRDAEILPKEFSLDQNYPNPFNPSTTIEYALPVRSRVRMTVYTALGQKVGELVNGVQEAGWQSAVWNAPLSSGLYIYTLTAVGVDDPAKQFSQTKKMMLVR